MLLILGACQIVGVDMYSSACQLLIKCIARTPWIYHHYCAMLMALVSLTWEIKGQPDCAKKHVLAHVHINLIITRSKLYELCAERSITISGMGCNARFCNASTKLLSMATIVYSYCFRKGWWNGRAPIKSSVQFTESVLNYFAIVQVQRGARGRRRVGRNNYKDGDMMNGRIMWMSTSQVQDGRIDYGEFVAMMQKGSNMGLGRRTMRKSLNMRNSLSISMRYAPGAH